VGLFLKTQGHFCKNARGGAGGWPGWPGPWQRCGPRGQCGSSGPPWTEVEPGARDGGGLANRGGGAMAG
jgi:hypothetical protein